MARHRLGTPYTWDMKTLALVSAVAATSHDDDLDPLLEACHRAGFAARSIAWDDATVSWSRFDAALLRSPWDYTERLPEFLRWCEHVERNTRLLNPLPVVRWNTDKHYLSELQTAGIPIVPTRFVEPDTEPLEALQTFLADETATELVVKPAVSAGSRNTQRYARSQDFAAGNHIARLLDQGRSVMLQPYQTAIDAQGETALIYFDGQFSHSIRKAAQLAADASNPTPYASAGISMRTPDLDELELGARVLDAAHQVLKLNGPLAYARIDLIKDETGAPRLLDMELTEPSLFFAHAPGSADRFATVLARHMNA